MKLKLSDSIFDINTHILCLNMVKEYEEETQTTLEVPDVKHDVSIWSVTSAIHGCCVNIFILL